MHHDPLDYTPATPSERSFWAAFIDLFRIRRNKSDERQAKAAAANKQHRDAMDATLRAMGRIGSGDGK